MAKIEIFHQAGAPWATRSTPAGEEPLAHSRLRHRGDEHAPELNEVRLRANSLIDVHAHATGEIIYVLSGQLLFGQHVLEAGASLYIPPLTLYSFRTGPQGVWVLGMHPKSDRSSFSKSDIEAMAGLDEKAKREYIAKNVADYLAGANSFNANPSTEEFKAV